MSKKRNQKLITPEILRQAVDRFLYKIESTLYDEKSCHVRGRSRVLYYIDAFHFSRACLAMQAASNLRTYNIIVSVILFITVLFANFAESVAEGRGKAQAASLKKTQKDTQARLLYADGTEKIVLSSELKKGDIVMVSAGEIIPGDGEVIEGIASVDESAITGESAPWCVNPAAISAPSPVVPPLFPTG